MDCASSQPFIGNCFPSTAGLRIFLLHLCGVFLRCVLQLNSWHRVFVLEFFFGTGLFACVWLFCGSPTIQSADSVAPVATAKPNAESAPLEPPNFQEQEDA